MTVPFGKRGRPVRPVEVAGSPDRRIGPRQVRSFTIGALALSGVAALVMLGGSIAAVQSPVKGTLASEFELDGLWVTDGQTCETANVLQELKNGTWTAVSDLGRFPVMSYSVSGMNPLHFDGGDGFKVIWDTSDPNYLKPVSILPEGSVKGERLTLSRC